MSEPTKPRSTLGSFSAFKVLTDDTKSPPALRRPTPDEYAMLIDGRAEQQAFLLLAEMLGRLIYGTWDKIRAATKKQRPNS